MKHEIFNSVSKLETLFCFALEMPTWALHSNKIKSTGGLEIKHTITAVSPEKGSETGLGS